MRLLVACVVTHACLTSLTSAAAAAAAASTSSLYAPYHETLAAYDPSYSRHTVQASGYYPPPDLPLDSRDYPTSFREPVYPDEDYYGDPEDYEHPQQEFVNSYFPSSYLQPPRPHAYAPTYSSHPEYNSDKKFIAPIHHSLSPNVINEESWEGRIPYPVPTTAPSFSPHPKIPLYHDPQPTYSSAATRPDLSSTPNIVRGDVASTSPTMTNFPELVPSPSPTPSVYPNSIPVLTPPTPISIPDTVSNFPLPPPYGYPDDGFNRGPLFLPEPPPERYPVHSNVIYEAPGHSHPKRR